MDCGFVARWQNGCMRRQAFIVFAILGAIAVFWFGVGSVAANLKLTGLGEKAASWKIGRIQREVTKLRDHLWAGNYYKGDGLGSNVTLDIGPENGFVFQEHGCVGVYDRNMGSISESDGMLKLGFAFSRSKRSVVPAELIPVRWGERAYLISPDEMPKFCDSVNRGREPRNDVHGEFLLRRGDENKRVNAFPGVPPEFRKLLLKHRIDGDIITVGATNHQTLNGNAFVDTKVVIDAGTHDGVRVGMVFYVVGPSRNDDSVEITLVSDKQCEGTLFQRGHDDLAPNLGWKVSTKPWNFF
jgi:hypothetical protein